VTSRAIIESPKVSIIADTCEESVRVDAIYITLLTNTTYIEVGSITNTVKAIPITIGTTILDAGLSNKNISTLTCTARTVPNRKLLASLANTVY
jgi:hypothetical protein